MRVKKPQVAQEPHDFMTSTSKLCFCFKSTHQTSNEKVLSFEHLLFHYQFPSHFWPEKNSVLVSFFLIFTPIWGNDFQFDEHIFQLGGEKHQPPKNHPVPWDSQDLDVDESSDEETKIDRLMEIAWDDMLVLASWTDKSQENFRYLKPYIQLI